MAQRRFAWFWQEILVGTAVLHGLVLRLNIAPTDDLLHTIGNPSPEILAMLAILDIFPLVVILGWTYEFGRFPGIAAFGVAAWAGYLLPVDHTTAVIWLLVAATLALFSFLWTQL